MGGSTSPFYQKGDENNRRCVYCNRIFTDIMSNSALPMCPDCVRAISQNDEEYMKKYFISYRE